MKQYSDGFFEAVSVFDVVADQGGGVWMRLGHGPLPLEAIGFLARCVEVFISGRGFIGHQPGGVAIGITALGGVGDLGAEDPVVL